MNDVIVVIRKFSPAIEEGKPYLVDLASKDDVIAISLHATFYAAEREAERLATMLNTRIFEEGDCRPEKATKPKN